MSGWRGLASEKRQNPCPKNDHLGGVPQVGLHKQAVLRHLPHDTFFLKPATPFSLGTDDAKLRLPGGLPVGGVSFCLPPTFTL